MAEPTRARSGAEMSAMLTSASVTLFSLVLLAALVSVLLDTSPAEHSDVMEMGAAIFSTMILAMLSFVTAVLVMARTPVARFFAIACALDTLAHHGAIAISFAVVGLEMWQPPNGSTTDSLYVPLELILEGGIGAIVLLALVIGGTHAASLIAFARGAQPS